MIDVTNSHIDYSHVDSPIKNDVELNEIRKSGDSTQRNFYQKMRRGEKRRTVVDFGPAVVVCLSDQVNDSIERSRIVLRYNRFCQLEYMDA